MLLTVGVMLCNLKDQGSELTGEEMVDSSRQGIIATLGIALCSGFASVYSEKVIKAKRNVTQQLPSKSDGSPKDQFGLAYTQVQLAFVRYAREKAVKNCRLSRSYNLAPALVSLLIMGAYCIVMELDIILEKGLFFGFNMAACISIFVSAIGGLIVAAVLKFADAGELVAAGML